MFSETIIPGNAGADRRGCESGKAQFLFPCGDIFRHTFQVSKRLDIRDFIAGLLKKPGIDCQAIGLHNAGQPVDFSVCPLQGIGLVLQFLRRGSSAQLKAFKAVFFKVVQTPEHKQRRVVFSTCQLFLQCIRILSVSRRFDRHFDSALLMESGGKLLKFQLLVLFFVQDPDSPPGIIVDLNRLPALPGIRLYCFLFVRGVCLRVVYNTYLCISRLRIISV